MSFWSSLAKIGGVVAAPFTGGASLAIPAALEAGGAMLSAGAQSAASNRGTKIDATLEQERLRQSQQSNFWQQLLAREKALRENQTADLQGLQRTGFLSSGAQRPTLTPYYSPQALNTDVLSGADALRQELLKRIQQGESRLPQVEQPTPFTIDPKLLKSGFWEKLAGIAGPAVSIYGAVAPGGRLAPANTK